MGDRVAQTGVEPKALEPEKKPKTEEDDGPKMNNE